MSARRSVRSFLTEGVVIVASTLLAFAIDAGWDGRQEAARRAARLEAMRDDFASTSERLDMAATTDDVLAALNRRIEA